MSVPAPRARKPKAADELVRVLRIYDWLVDEMARRARTGPSPRLAWDSAYLTIAERIAARTVD